MNLKVIMLSDRSQSYCTLLYYTNECLLYDPIYMKFWTVPPNCGDRRERRPTWLPGQRGASERAQEPLGWRAFHSQECGDGFLGEYTCQNLANFTL